MKDQPHDRCVSAARVIRIDNDRRIKYFIVSNSLIYIRLFYFLSVSLHMMVIKTKLVMTLTVKWEQDLHFSKTCR